MAAQKTQGTDYKEQAKRIKELTARINKRAQVFAKAQQGKGTYFGDLAKVCQSLEDELIFLGGII